MFDSSLLDRVAGNGPGSRSGSVQLLGHRPVSAGAGRRLYETIGYLRQHVLNSREEDFSPLLASTAAQHLAACVLTALPNTALFEPTAADRRDDKPAVLRRAIAYIEENAQDDISIVDIARAVFVTPRALQYMFRRSLDMSPMEYLRRVRLCHVHLELMHADPSKTTVSAVAARWGFAHAGRFAVTYRQVYGRSPHQTLRD